MTGSRSGGFGCCDPLTALDAESWSHRFRRWRGASGRYYVFSVFRPETCPDYCDAILLIAEVDEAGQRKRLSVLDTGTFPGPFLKGLARELEQRRGRIEFQIHLLADSAAEREAAIRDLQAEA